jgi:hypothetical protein
MVTTTDVINAQVNYFTTTIKLVLYVILVVNVCNHICDYSVDIIK